MPDNENDLYVPDPTPEEMARFRADLNEMQEALQEHFGSRPCTKTALEGIAAWATMWLQGHEYSFHCSAIEVAGGNVSVHLEPLTLKAARMHILVATPTGARVMQ